MGKNRRPAEPVQKTAFGCVHEIMRGIFEDAALLSTTVKTSSLNTGAGTIDTVAARAVKKDGRLTICAVNLSDQPSDLTIKVDQNDQHSVLTLEAFAFDDLAATTMLDIDTNPLKQMKLTDNRITLPPLSVNKIVMADGNRGETK
jgi:hypothetical protein